MLKYSDRHLKQILKDINWILTTKPLISWDYNLQLTLKPLTNKPLVSISIETLHSIPHKIGFYYQWLLSKIIEANDELKLIGEDVQVFHNNQTLGSLDFLIKNEDNEIEHWEVAVKFFLAWNGQWLGPNAIDSLEKKHKKMLEKQIQLSSSPSFHAQFPTITVQHQKCHLQGRLYSNPYLSPTHIDTKKIVHERVTGLWCFYSQWPKSTPIYPLKYNEWFSLPSVNELSPCKLPSLLSRAIHVLDEKAKPWFIVPDDWPAN